jgi:hypothetical protein
MRQIGGRRHQFPLHDPLLAIQEERVAVTGAFSGIAIESRRAARCRISLQLSYFFVLRSPSILYAVLRHIPARF